MTKVTWEQVGIYYNARRNNSTVGCCWKGAEIEGFYYASHKGSGVTDSMEEAKKRIEELNDK